MNRQKRSWYAVLNSGWFAHAPGLAQFLAYVGSKWLEGQANHIKEYNIAVEALGRPHILIRNATPLFGWRHTG